MRASRTAWLIIALAVSATAAGAQESLTISDDRQSAASRYVFGDNGDLLMPVNVLGAVEKSGQYMVPSDTDLLALLAFAGGLREDASLKNIRIVRRIENQKKQRSIHVDLKDLYEKGEGEAPARLLPDDMVIVGKKSVVTSRAVSDIFRSVAFAAQTIYIVYLISKKD